MDIVSIARKLEPILPETVDQWRRTRELVDTDMRSLLDKQIISLAYQELGDFHKKPLLSLPPENKSKGIFNLGTILYESEKWDFGLSKNELLQHLGIFGRSGSGKTNVTFHLLLQLLQQKINVLFLDWKKTARHLIPSFKGKVTVYTPGKALSPFSFNPFIVPDGLEPRIYINQIIDIMASVYTLGEGVKHILQKAFIHCYQKTTAPTVDDLLNVVKDMDAKGRQGGWKISAVRALESMVFSDMVIDNKSQQTLVNTLLHDNTILELDGLDQNSKDFLSAVVCLWIYYTKLGQNRREQLDFVIILEEAHHLLHQHSGRESVMELLLRQARELGLAFVIIDQHPSLMSKSVLNNIHTSICLNQKDTGDTNRAAALSLLKDDEKHYLSRLPVGQGIVKLQSRWYDPILIQFPLVSVKKGAVTDKLLAKYLAYQKFSQADSRGKNFKMPEFEQFPQFPLKDYVADKGELMLLDDILKYPDDGVSKRYHRLKLSAGTGDRIKNKLITQGWLESKRDKTANYHKVVLSLTKQACDFLGIDAVSSKIKVDHEYWKNWYAQKFKDEGYKVQMEASRVNGRVDVLAIKDGEKIGIEIETGKSDVVSNVKNGLLSKFDQVIVVATDKKAMVKVEKQLAKAGFILPARVMIVLQYKLPALLP